MFIIDLRRSFFGAPDRFEGAYLIIFLTKRKMMGLPLGGKSQIERKFT
jgi:hypothetical protein